MSAAVFAAHHDHGVAHVVEKETSIAIVSVVMMSVSQENEEEIVTRPWKAVLGEADAVQVVVYVVGFELSAAVAVVVDSVEIFEIRERPSSLSPLLSFCPIPSNIQHPGVVSGIFV